MDLILLQEIEQTKEDVVQDEELYQKGYPKRSHSKLNIWKAITYLITKENDAVFKKSIRNISFDKNNNESK